jgi:VanZ family protein
LPSTKLRPAFAILAISIAVIAGHLLPGLDNSSVEGGIRNSLHLLVFAVFSIIAFESLKSSGLVIPILATMIVVGAIGSLSEFLQYVSGKRPDVFDVIRDLSGAGLALTGRLLWLWGNQERNSPITKLARRSASVLVSALIVVPLLFWASILGLGRISAPVIIDFDQWWNQYIYRPINAEIVTTANAVGTAELLLLKWRRSGIVISPMVTDWSDYDYLTITAGMLEGPDTNVTVRINDSERRNSWSDEFLASIIVNRAVAKIRIPLSELVDEAGQLSMDLTDIQELVIFARDSRNDTVMVFDDIRLE